MIVTFGLLALFFAFVVWTLHRNRVLDQSFTDYAVGGRSFGARYQAMSFLNTWYPGSMFTAFGALSVTAGVMSFYVLSYSLLTVVLLFVLARPVWIWGKTYDLKTQGDLFALRYGSRHIRTIAAVIGIISGLPWLVLGMQALGNLFQAMSLGALSFSTSVIVGVVVIAIRQIWTVRMGMRGVVISDYVQGIVAYVFGGLMLVILSVWLVQVRGATLWTIDPKLYAIPGLGSKEGPLYLFALMFTGALGGWCWPYIFVRLFTADGVKSLKKSAALAVPLTFLFGVALLIFGMLASTTPEALAKPDDVWFIISEQAGGVVLLGLAGVVLLAASMGHTDGNIQAYGAQLANDLVGNYVELDQKQMIVIAKGGMLLLTLLASWLATLTLPALFSLAVLAYQGIIQLAIPQFLGIFWRKGNREGAIAGMIVGFVTAVGLELAYGGQLPFGYGLTSGCFGLATNLAVYVALAYLLPRSDEESRRIDGLFAAVGRPRAINATAGIRPQSQPI
ncbi:sodium:solute symporter family protein [Hansschlegelia sp.]|uniref:sodium:solute symporter family protein n=1 Tax=Hansschlegelia sp. TaxID=2041892 RepID=UPI002B7ED4E2|nr:sodium:solute symporter family protein [Hansschlegelia sp.]HVI27601.1 sodium:solute symporter family protein [Hansschlegelia sp.]